MIKITQKASNALFNQTYFSEGTTRVMDSGLYVFNNKIASNYKGVLTISNRGFLTPTFMDRLNGVLDAFNLGLWLFQEKALWFISDKSGRKTRFPTNTWVNLTDLMKGAN